MVQQVRVVQLELLDDRADLVHQRDQLARRGRAAVDAEPLLQAVQVRRAEQACTKPAGRERGRHHRRRRAFALGPRNVDHPQATCGSPSRLEQPPHPAQPQLGGDLGMPSHS